MIDSFGKFSQRKNDCSRRISLIFRSIIYDEDAVIPCKIA